MEDPGPTRHNRFMTRTRSRSVDAKKYWESIHEENSAGDVSWYRSTPRVALQFLEKLDPRLDARALDVGCGQAGIAGHLVERGFRHVSALDISAEAIRRAKEGLGAHAGAVDWIEGDVLDLVADAPFDVWHDCAVLHFFTDALDQRRYCESAMRNVAPGGHAIIATFAPDGPEKCSGLPVQRHDATSIERLLRPGFTPAGSDREIHTTPWGTKQAFQWVLLRRSEGTG